MAQKRVVYLSKEQSDGRYQHIEAVMGDETMLEMVGKIDAFARLGQSVLFNTAMVDVNPKLYVCTIFIDTAKNAVRVTDATTGRLYIGKYDAEETLKSVLSKAVDPYGSLTIEVVNALGTAVSGRTVKVYEGSGSGGTLKREVEYDGKPVTFVVERGFRYYIEVLGGEETLTTSGTCDGAETAILRYTNLEVKTFGDVKSVVNYYETQVGGLEIAKSILVGKLIDDVWVNLDTQENGDAEPKRDENNHPRWLDPMFVIDVKQVEDENGETHLGAVLRRKYATINSIVIDRENREVATEPTAQVGVYYYGHAPEYSNEKTYLQNAIVRYNGEFYQSTVAITAPEDFDAAKWSKKTATTYTANGFELLNLEEGAAIPYDKYAQVFKNAYRDTSKNILLYGHNRYETSVYHQYLNSDADKGGWWEQKHIGQLAPTNLNSIHGYMAGCSAELLAAAKSVKVLCDSNYVCDGGSNTDERQAQYTVDAKFFLPCISEMFGTDNPLEGDKPFDFWQFITGNPAITPNNNNNDKPDDALLGLNDARIGRSVKGKSSAVSLRLRSVYRGSSNSDLLVSMTGTLSNNNAITASASAPACVIY